MCACACREVGGSPGCMNSSVDMATETQTSPTPFLQEAEDMEGIFSRAAFLLVAGLVISGTYILQGNPSANALLSPLYRGQADMPSRQLQHEGRVLLSLCGELCHLFAGHGTL